MNTKLALAAIALFAVTMGISMLSPAVAAKMDRVEICHFAEEETVLVDTDGDGIPDTPVVEPAQWLRITVNGNSVDAHIANHADENGQHDFVIEDQATSDVCDALIATNP
jgi:hypothetical protein